MFQNGRYMKLSRLFNGTLVLANISIITELFNYANIRIMHVIRF
jgi:hypothetical protein